MKKKIMLILSLVLVIGAGLSFFFIKPKVIKKSYNGFYINTTTKEVIGTCNITINISLKKKSIDEFKKMCKFYTGTLIIDDEEYKLKGNTALNDELEYRKNSEGDNEIAFSTEVMDDVEYDFSMYEGFKDDYVLLRMEDELISHKYNTAIIGTNNDNVEELIGNIYAK